MSRNRLGDASRPAHEPPVLAGTLVTTVMAIGIDRSFDGRPA
ncbi:MAG TPA: hypothetical protein VHZ24_07360 [Pirellulales bacterium]|nr:hypothetical protein [Pirellulales bacterium]